MIGCVYSHVLCPGPLASVQPGLLITVSIREHTMLHPQPSLTATSAQLHCSLTIASAHPHCSLSTPSPQPQPTLSPASPRLSPGSSQPNPSLIPASAPAQPNPSIIQLGNSTIVPCGRRLTWLNQLIPVKQHCCC